MVETIHGLMNSVQTKFFHATIQRIHERLALQRRLGSVCIQNLRNHIVLGASVVHHIARIVGGILFVLRDIPPLIYQVIQWLDL
jgi:hypothetical protein